MHRLDDLIPARPTRLLKIDVEGSELPVLQGATAVLRETELVYCELSTGNCRRFGYEPQDVETLLLEAGFVFIRRDDEGRPQVSKRAYFSSLPTEDLPATGYNLVAVRPSVSQEALEMLSARGWFRR